MFRNIARPGLLRTYLPSVRYNSTLAELSQAIKTPVESEYKATNNSIVSDIDHLLLADSAKESATDAASPASNNESTGFKNGALYGGAAHPFGRASSSDYLLQQSVRHPREVAKSIRVFGPIAGRTFDVRHGNIGATIASVQTVLRTNKIKKLVNVQKRHIPKAKYRKQKHREWWRRQFSKGFRELMSEVRDATRRGY
ncbi:hypothetical protein CAAN1_05S00716 [[Candida] anglica]|uniref:Ribosomal protein S21 n=1 Tax=[Candida] anglica TaxID=148631 RepID=A0ABP0EFC0_9ASCO